MTHESNQPLPPVDAPEAILRLAEEIGRALGAALAKEPPPAGSAPESDTDPAQPCDLSH